MTSLEFTYLGCQFDKTLNGLLLEGLCVLRERERERERERALLIAFDPLPFWRSGCKLADPDTLRSIRTNTQIIELQIIESLCLIW